MVSIRMDKGEKIYFEDELEKKKSELVMLS